jgi:predicted nucleic-acid-binding protein
MRAIDTNVLVRLLAQDDPRQVIAAEAFVAPGAWVSHLVLAEAMWVLASVFARTPRAIATCVAMLLEHESIVVQDTDTVQAALDHFSRRPTLGFSDCLILEIARKAGHSPLGTFDRALSKLDGVEKI